MARIEWQLGEVIAIIQETPTVKTFRLKLPNWTVQLPGQHYDLRLTAEDGYQAERSYSIASPPEQIGEIDLTIEWLEEGEVSAYLHEGVTMGDLIEVRGPIGGYFVWQNTMVNKPLLLVGGGSGIVPLMAILRHRSAIKATNPTRLLYSVGIAEETIFGQELGRLAGQDTAFSLTITYTRQAPENWPGNRRRIDKEMLAKELGQYVEPPLCFICGPTELVELAANLLVDLGIPADHVYAERFGSTNPGNV